MNNRLKIFYISIFISFIIHSFSIHFLNKINISNLIIQNKEIREILMRRKKILYHIYHYNIIYIIYCLETIFMKLHFLHSYISIYKL